MKVLLVLSAFLHLALGASIVDVTCPDSCKCQITNEYMEISCYSYEFIKKLLPKQEMKIVRLTINNSSLINVDLKLKYLKNLNFLDISNNKIATLPSQFPYLPKLKIFNVSRNNLNNVVFAQLPKNLEVVDVSHNKIMNFPKDWSSLKQLKTLYIHDNPINCDCDNLNIYEQLRKAEVIDSSNLTCYYPKEFHGQSLNSVNCTLIKENLLNSMLGDEAGSGSEEVIETEFKNNVQLADEEEFIKAEGFTKSPEEDVIEEGSGDEGSGAGDILSTDFVQPITACHFNCSTPRPIGLNDEKDASPPPGVFEEAKTIFEDILQPDKVNEEHKVDETSTLEPKEVEESPMIKQSDKNDLIETVPTNDTVIGKMQRVKTADNQSVYIIVGLMVAFVTFLIIYFVNKKRNQRKRNQRKRNKSNENGYGEEMKPLGKSAETAKPTDQVNSNSKLPIPETAPLLNGQNGKIAEDTTLKTQAEDNDDEDVELRKPEQMDTLTPQPERVTIKAGELPDSIPKTPLLVHRQLNSDGEIVTTTVGSN